jgi:DNA repair exonuclease SbcCD ATPase subunit
MRVIRLQARNVKRLKAIDITPTGDVVTVSGHNAMGKSSVLDAIAIAIGGKDLMPTRPVRDGEKQGKVRLDLGDFIVTRTFNATGGGTLTVKNPEGLLYPSPQAMLDKLVGRLSFDPMEFKRLKPKAQLEAVRDVAHLDTTLLDKQRADVYGRRTAANAKRDDLQSKVATMTRYDDAPAEEVSVLALTQELQGAQSADRAAESIAEALRGAESTIAATTHAERSALDRIKALEESIAHERDVAAKHRKDCDAAMARAKQLDVDHQQARGQVPDIPALVERIGAAESTNAKVRANLAAALLNQDALLAEVAAQTLDDEVKAIDARKVEMTEQAAYPVPGLGVTDAGVTYQGVPFEDCSTAEQLRVSVAMGIALNPKLRVLLIREGNDLDAANLKLLAEMAEAADCQIWLERVSEDGAGMSVFIEDGEEVKD